MPGATDGNHVAIRCPCNGCVGTVTRSGQAGGAASGGEVGAGGRGGVWRRFTGDGRQAEVVPPDPPAGAVAPVGSEQARRA